MYFSKKIILCDVYFSTEVLPPVATHGYGASEKKTNELALLAGCTMHSAVWLRNSHVCVSTLIQNDCNNND